MIERLPYPKVLFAPPLPLMGVKERALLECGCHVWVGMRVDLRELATAVFSCSPEHLDLIHHFNMLLQESTVEPEDEELVVVCERLLEEAQRHYV
jgi:hypothetical protein